MANMAASTYELFGFECAVVPFDMGIEAEVLGCKINYYAHRDGILYPTINTKVAEKAKDAVLKLPPDLANAGRVPVVTKAIHRLKEEVGDQVAIGAWTLGPHLVAAQVIDMADLSKQMYKNPEMITKILDVCADLVISLAGIYKEAGADYITIREMGAGADILSPDLFERLVVPQLKKVFAAIASPNVLHICGSTDPIIELMGSCGADGISVEERNHIAETRKKLGPDALIFGNIAGYNAIAAGKPKIIDRAVKEAIENGVSAVWPGCDIFPDAPEANMKKLVSAVKKYGKLA
jgi:[methyl-Co(III) methanol-specific corrinoid protein]:coenzyme M methyltransferase